MQSPINRWLFQHAVLFAVNLRARLLFARGLLDGVATIHFAHWHVFDRGRRLLFISNYDGSWAAYLDDFITFAAKPLTAIWSHSEGFPKTRYLLFDGAADGPRFKAYARATQLPPEVWYSAYPRLSAEQIRDDAALVEGLENPKLGHARYRDRAREWLRLI